MKVSILIDNIPGERASEFCTMVDAWLRTRADTSNPPQTPTPAAEAEAETEGKALPWTSPHDDLAAGRDLWSHGNPKGLAIMRELIQHPDDYYYGEDLANKLGLWENGRHGVAGSLGWLGKYCKKIGRKQCWKFGTYPGEELYVYWLTPDLADFWRRVDESFSEAPPPPH